MKGSGSNSSTLCTPGFFQTPSKKSFAPIMAGTPARQIGRIDPETGDYIWFDRKTEESR